MAHIQAIPQLRSGIGIFAAWGFVAWENQGIERGEGARPVKEAFGVKSLFIWP